MKKIKKEILSTIIAVIILISITLGIIIYSDINNKKQTTLDDGKTFSGETCEMLKTYGDGIIIHQLGCPHCAIVIPILREIANEKNLNFSYYDLAIENDRKIVLDKMNLLPLGVPTFIYDCKVYVGQRTKEEYLGIIK